MQHFVVFESKHKIVDTITYDAFIATLFLFVETYNKSSVLKYYNSKFPFYSEISLIK